MKFKLIVLLIGAIFFITRFYGLTKIPESVYWDEASIGYNAYSISQNLRDEWGEFLPLHFRAFGEFKLPVYIYSVAPFVKLFGLNNFSVRIPVVIYSFLSVILAGSLAYRLFKDKKIALLVSFFLTISPWFFIFSRTGYEATAGLFYFLLGIYLFLIQKENRWYIILSALSFVVSVYSYNSYRILSVLTFVFLFFISLKRNEIRRNIAPTLVGLFLIVVSFIPIIKLIIYDAGFSRAETFSLFPHIQQVYDLEGNPKLQLIYDRFNVPNWGENIVMIGKNYFSHLSLPFLIGGDGNPRSQIPTKGQVYILDLVFLLVVVFSFLRKKNKNLLTIFVLLFLSILPASIFKESPHALRTLSVAPLLSILVALGFNQLSTKFALRRAVTLIVIGYYLISFSGYYNEFTKSYFTENSKEWQYSYKLIFDENEDLINQSEKVIVSDELGQPYIFALYYQKVAPNNFLESRGLNPVDRWGFSTVASFGKFEFREPTVEDYEKGYLVFSSTQFDGLIEEKIIKELNGEPSLWAYIK